MIARLVHDKQPEQQMRFFENFLFEQPKEELLTEPIEQPKEELLTEPTGEDSSQQPLSLKEDHVSIDVLKAETEVSVEAEADITEDPIPKSFRFSEKEGPWGSHYPWMDLDALPKFYTDPVLNT